jgi:hypothetical protein
MVIKHILKFAMEYYNSLVKKIPFDEISVYMRGLRQESFEYLTPFFVNSSRKYPDKLKPVELVVYENEPKKIFVQDGRHRLLLSKKYDIKHVPAIIRHIDEQGYNILEDNVIIEN